MSLGYSPTSHLGQVPLLWEVWTLKVTLVNMATWGRVPRAVTQNQPFQDSEWTEEMVPCVLLPTTGLALPIEGKMKVTQKMALVVFSSGDFLKDRDCRVQLPRILSSGNGSNPPRVLECPLGATAQTGLNPRASFVPALSPASLFPGLVIHLFTLHS